MADYKNCTKDSPMPQGDKGRWTHEDAVEVGDQRDGYPGGDIQDYRCPNCGKEFSCELPQ